MVLVLHQSKDHGPWLLKGTLLSSGKNISGAAVGGSVAGGLNYTLGNTG